MKVSDSKMIRSTLIIMLALLTMGLLTPVSPTAAATSPLEFRNAMRKLWEDHITWTRLYIVSAAADLADKDATAQRLLRNQEDIGNAIKPFYGDAAGSQLTALLKDHILGAVDLIAAAKAGDNAKIQDASNKWYANADDIATFLSNANPGNWPLDQMKMGMKMHLDLTLNEATDHLKENYVVDVADYDKVHEHILGLADTLSDGIVNQFPERFGGAPGPVGMPRTGNGQYSLWAAWFALALVGGLGAAGGWHLLRRDASLRQSLAIHAGAAEPRDVSRKIKR